MKLYTGDLRGFLQTEYNVEIVAPRLLKNMLGVLEFLDEQEIVHGDIKPANILHDDKGEFYLTDFGLMGSSSLGKITAATALYAAPEVYYGQTTPASDIWSLSVVLLDVLKIRPKHPRTLAFRYQYDQYHRNIVSAAATFPWLTLMLCISPEGRASAARCLDILNLRERVTDAAAPDAIPTQNVDISMTTEAPGQY